MPYTNGYYEILFKKKMPKKYYFVFNSLDNGDGTYSRKFVPYKTFKEAWANPEH